MSKSCLLSFVLVAMILPQGFQAASLPGNNIRVTYIDSANDWWGAEKMAAALAVPGYAETNEYNYIFLAFILHSGPSDALNIWATPFGYMEKGNNPFGQDEDQVKRSWQKSFHDAGKKILISAFGATEFPTSAGYEPTSYCTKLANFVRDNHLDGIDLDYEDDAQMEQGSGEDWLIRCTKAIRQVLPKGQYILTHAPQAIYFAGKSVYPNGGYLTVDQQVGDLIDWYNIQFYNQLETSYDTYEKLFINTQGYYGGTSVKQIMDKGIPKDKIVIGKPMTQKDADNTGFVSAIDLHNWAQRAANEIGWSSGIMNWELPSDNKGTFLKTYLHGY